MKSPEFPPNEAGRLQALRGLNLLDTPPEESLDRVVRMVSRIFEVPIALVTLVDADRQFFKACYGLDMTETTRGVSFCGHAILSDEVMVVADATKDSRFADNPLVTGELGVRFYAGAPLRISAGVNIGTLCVIDVEPREFSVAERTLLADMADLVMDGIELIQAGTSMRSEIARRRKAEVELSEREQVLTSIFELSPDIISFIDSEGINVRVSPAVREVLGYDPAELEGVGSMDLIHPDDLVGVAGAFQDGLSDGDTEEGRVRYRIRHSDGHWVTLESSGRIRLDSDGNPIGAIGVSRDITEQIRLEEQVGEARVEAERANSAKSEFLSRMSHELRTPLNAVLGFAQLLEMDDLDSDQSESVGHIMNAGRHLLDLINEVLDISRIESGRLAMSIEPVEVGEVIDEVMAMARSMAEQYGVRLDDADASGFDAVASADRKRLAQIVLNLVSNGIKFNEKGGTVSVRCDLADAMVRVSVADNGPGMSEESLSRLFVPFQRLDADERGIEGTGIGLALSSSLAKAMEGSLDVSSEVGSGSTFTLSLPQAPDRAKAPSQNPARAPVSDRKASGTVLYIEDNRLNLELMEEIFEQRPSLELITVRLGNQGLQQARQRHPDLVLLDLGLPDAEGHEVLADLRGDAATQDIPVVMISAEARESERKRLIDLGARDYLTKPIDVKGLLALVDEIIEEGSR